MSSVSKFMDGLGKELSEAKSYSEMKRIMDNSELEYLGSGSARLVYKIDDNNIVKIAKNQFGLHQNAVETDHFVQNEYGEFLTETKDYDDENYRFVIAEFAGKLKSDKDLFKKLEEFYNIDEDSFKKFTDNLNSVILKNDSNSYKKLDEILESSNNNPLLEQMKNMCMDTDIVPGDFTRHSSWGVVENEEEKRLVIKDYGLNKENFNTYVRKDQKSPKPTGPRGPYM